MKDIICRKCGDDIPRDSDKCKSCGVKIHSHKIDGKISLIVSIMIIGFVILIITIQYFKR